VLSLRRGSVTAVTERHERLVRLEVDGRPCVAYPGITGPVALGDDVLVNVQAVELGLGSGGFDVLYANLTRGLGLEAEVGAHVMKLPYTPLQHAVRHAEEDGARLESLRGLPVVCCSLHSQVGPASAGLGEGLRVAYVQVPGGSLPVSLSDTVRALRERGLVETSVAVGACVEGDVACVSTAAALVWAAEEGYDAVMCSTAGSPWRKPWSPPGSSKAGPSSPCAIRKAIRGSVTAVCRTTRARCSRLREMSRSRGPRGSRGRPS
jgi:hypothetical protein